MVEIAVQTEDKYGVKIPDEDLAGLRTVGDVVAYIQKLEEENPERRRSARSSQLQMTMSAPSYSGPSTASGVVSWNDAAEIKDSVEEAARNT